MNEVNFDKVFLMGKINIDLLKVDIATPNFFDTITSNLLVPGIILPARNTTTIIYKRHYRNFDREHLNLIFSVLSGINVYQLKYTIQMNLLIYFLIELTHLS